MKDKQYIVFIDESNILSNTGHSVYICVYIEFFNKNILDNSILEIENKLNIYYTHWIDMPWKIRLNFAKKIKYLDFFYKIKIYKNPIDQKCMLEKFILNTLDKKESIHNVIIDGKKGKKYERKLKSILNNNFIKIYKICIRNDKTEPLLRLADFIAGYYRSYIDNKNKYNEYIHNVLKNKIKTPND